jgi:hypothetical protein
VRIGLVLLAALAVAGSAGAASGPATIRVWSIPTSNRITDVSPKGRLNAGDVVQQRTRLVNAVRQFGKPSGAVVGYDESVIRLTSATRAVVDTVAHLPGGTLHAHGIVTLGRSPSTIHVSSGTGVFTGAQGTTTETDYANANRALNVYRLTYGAVA